VAAGSTRLRVRVSPGARETRIVGRHGDAWKVRVAAPPERGRANEELLRHLADRLDLPREALALVTGAGGREKLVALDGLAKDEADRRLADAVEVRA
jgi:uncharacterized protein (TIGR00251 family)